MTSPITLRHRLQLRNIAVLTDLGSDAERTLHLAASIAQWYGAKLTVAHACTADVHIPSSPDPLSRETSGDLSKNQSEHLIRSLVGSAVQSPAMVSTIVSSSNVDELLEQLTLRQPDLLVVATHARTGISKWLAGSVMAEVARRAQWPVLVLPPGLLNSGKIDAQFQRVLYATDLSDVSARAFPYAVGIAEDHRAQMVAVHVDSDGTAYSFERLIALQRLEDWLHRQSVAHGGGQWPECAIRFGEPAEEIVQAASEYQADLIVIGARGLGAMSRIASHFVGGTAYEVTCLSACPVLIVPHAS